MTVLHVTPYCAPAWAFGDVARDVSELAHRQCAEGHRVIVLTTDAVAPHERLPRGESSVEGVRVIRVRNLSGVVRMWLHLSTPIGLGARARALLRSEPIDIVHLHELRTVENLIVVAEAAGAVPLVLSPHNTIGPVTHRSRAKRAWDASIGDVLLTRIRHLVARSEAEAEEITSLYRKRGVALHPDAVTVVGNGIDVSAVYSRVLATRTPRSPLD